MEVGALGTALLLVMVNDLATLLGADCEVGLLTGDIDPGPDTPLADLAAAEPAGDWYDRLPALPGDVYQDAQENYGLPFDCVTWLYSGTDEGETITGWFIASKAVVVGDIPINTVVAARRLNSSQAMGNVLNQVRVDPSILFPPIAAA